MMVNEFEDSTFECAGSAETGYNCMYQSELAALGKIKLCWSSLGIARGYRKSGLGL